MAISKGDLVRVKKSHCSAAAAIEYGIHRIVLDVATPKEWEYFRCHGCGGTFTSPGQIAELGPDGWHPSAWLQRIDPPQLSDDTDTEKEREHA